MPAKGTEAQTIPAQSHVELHLTGMTLVDRASLGVLESILQNQNNRHFARRIVLVQENWVVTDVWMGHLEEALEQGWKKWTWLMLQTDGFGLVRSDAN